MSASARRKRRGAGPPAVSESTPATPSRALLWIYRLSPALAIAFVLLGVLRIVAAYALNSITFDEPGHLACGLQWLGQHVYEHESQALALARQLGATAA